MTVPREPASSPVVAGGLARLLEVEARLEARLAVTEAEAAALVGAARRDGEIRLASLSAELEALAAARARELDALVASRLVAIEARATERLAQLAALPTSRRTGLVQEVVDALLAELMGGRAA